MTCGLLAGAEEGEIASIRARQQVGRERPGGSGANRGDFAGIEHRHRAIGFVTPTQRHAGLDSVLLEQRAIVYERARQDHPERWSCQARQWDRVETVHLNPETPHSEESAHVRKRA